MHGPEGSQVRVRRPPLVWPVILVVAVVLTACGSSSKKASTATTAASTTTTTAASLAVATDAKLGPILVDGEGRTLYRFAKDVNGTIACTGNCATTWPPFVVTGTPPQAPDGGGTVATVDRPDGGGTQVTFNGAPLYRYSGDSKPGDTNGQGIGGVWFVVAPTAAAVTATTAAPAAGATATTARSTATTARTTATTARPVTNATTAPTSPPATSPPATSPPTTMHTVTTTCAYPPCY
ncbi:MAG: hypothetical protein JOY57_17660 [Actinobacteria bacterium]|nr:hypothetical protein [Actinomycetota bacterium]